MTSKTKNTKHKSNHGKASKNHTEKSGEKKKEKKKDWRHLTEFEKSLLQRGFGNELDLSVIKVFHTTIWTIDAKLRRGRYSRVLGNNLHFYKPDFNLYNKEDRQHFFHEAAHVWQYQNFGSSYAFKAVWAQVTMGEEAYSYQKLLDKGVPFKLWNPEAQAAWISVNEGLPWVIIANMGFRTV